MKQQNPMGLTVTTSAAKASYNVARVVPSSQEDIRTGGPGHGPTGLCVWEAQLPKAWREGHTLHASEARVLGQVTSQERPGQLSRVLGNKTSA